MVLQTLAMLSPDNGSVLLQQSGFNYYRSNCMVGKTRPRLRVISYQALYLRGSEQSNQPQLSLFQFLLALQDFESHMPSTEDAYLTNAEN